MKKYQKFSTKIVIFYSCKNSCILHGRVCVMTSGLIARSVDVMITSDTILIKGFTVRITIVEIYSATIVL